MSWTETFTTTFSNGTELILTKLRGWLEGTIEILPNFVLALLVVFVANLLSKLARAIVQKILEGSRIPAGPSRVLAGATRVAVMVAGLFIALSVLQLDKTVTSLLAGAGVIGLALSFAFQDLASNFISGLFLTIQRPLNVGDYIRTNDFAGHVEHIGLRAMTLVDLDGQHVVIPSKDVFQTPVINYSTEKVRRVNLDVGVSYASDLELVERVTKEAIEELDFVLDDRPVAIHWNGFGGSSIDFTLRFWIGSSGEGEYCAALAKALKCVKKTFDQHDITIPFPIRTLDFGIEGGRTADEVIEAMEARKAS